MSGKWRARAGGMLIFLHTVWEGNTGIYWKLFLRLYSTLSFAAAPTRGRVRPIGVKQYLNLHVAPPNFDRPNIQQHLLYKKCTTPVLHQKKTCDPLRSAICLVGNALLLRRGVT